MKQKQSVYVLLRAALGITFAFGIGFVSGWLADKFLVNHPSEIGREAAAAFPEPGQPETGPLIYESVEIADRSWRWQLERIAPLVAEPKTRCLLSVVIRVSESGRALPGRDRKARIAEAIEDWKGRHKDFCGPWPDPETAAHITVPAWEMAGEGWQEHRWFTFCRNERLEQLLGGLEE